MTNYAINNIKLHSLVQINDQMLFSGASLFATEVQHIKTPK